MNQEKQKQIIDNLKSGYNFISEHFASTRQNPWPEMAYLAKFVKTGDRVLDLGCGHGRLYGLLREKGIEYVGVDNSVKLIDLAKNNFKIQISNFKINPNVKIQNSEPEFMVEDMTQPLSFRDNTFDAVFMVASYHHIPSNDLRKQVLKEIWRVLKPGGLLLMTNWNLYAWKNILKYKLYQQIKKTNGQEKNDFIIPWKEQKNVVFERFYHNFTKRELKDLLKNNWKIEECFYSEKGKKQGFLFGEELVTIAQKIAG